MPRPPIEVIRGMREDQPPIYFATVKVRSLQWSEAGSLPHVFIDDLYAANCLICGCWLQSEQHGATR